MAHFIDPFYTNNFLDANIFDEIAHGKNEAVTKILSLSDSEKIVFLLPYSVQHELQDPNTPESVVKASQGFGYSIKVYLTENEGKLYESLVKDASGEAQTKNIASDLFHVFEAAKYGGGHFITLDKRLLKRRDRIEESLGIEVLTPEAFLEKVHVARERNAEFENRKQAFVSPAMEQSRERDMSMHREYKGIEIHAHSWPSGELHVPFVTLTKHTARGVNEIKLEPPCEKGCETEDEALQLAMEYGLAAVDGEVEGFDPRSLL